MSLVVATLAAAFAIGCGDSQSELDRPARAQPADSLVKAGAVAAFTGSASDVANRLGCEKPLPNPDRQYVNADDQLICEYQGETVLVLAWSSAARQDAAEAELRAAGAADAAYYARGDGWTVGLLRFAPPDIKRKIAEAAAAELGGELVEVPAAG